MIVEKLDGPRVSGEQFPRPCYLATLAGQDEDFCVSWRFGERAVVSIGVKHSEQPWLSIDLGAMADRQTLQKLEMLEIVLKAMQDVAKTVQGVE